MRCCSRSCAPVLLLFAFALSGCNLNRQEELDDPIPPGVSVDPPRTIPATGGLAVPGQVQVDTTSGPVTGSGSTVTDTTPDTRRQP